MGVLFVEDATVNCGNCGMAMFGWRRGSAGSGWPGKGRGNSGNAQWGKKDTLSELKQRFLPFFG